MKAGILCVCLTTCLAAAAAAQGSRKNGAPTRPDLSGTWVLDRSKSYYGQAWGNRFSKTDSTLVITHSGPEMRITKTLIYKGQRETKEYAYYTDGRGESNPMYYGSGMTRTKTVWKGDGVDIRYCYGPETQVWCGGSGGGQKWHLSADGQTLAHTTTYGGGFGGGYSGDFPSVAAPEQSGRIKLVYRRAP